MKKTINTAILSLAVGCFVISIYEIISRGIGVGYPWLMAFFVLWMWYGLRRRKEQLENKQAAEDKSNKISTKKSAVSKSGRKRK